jgi:predicted chitinase
MSVKSALIVAGVGRAKAAAEAPLAEAAMLEFDITSQARAQQFLAQVLHESGGLQFFEEIADGSAYEGRRDLGNTQPGDGRRFKGRGPIQLTGRANYHWAGRLLKLPLEQQPTIAAQHKIGWRIAGLYWKSHGLNELADRGDFIAITKRINGGTNGLAARQAYLRRLRESDCRPQDRWAGYTAAERRWITEYDRTHDVGRRNVLRRVMRSQRKRIWKAAQAAEHGGDGHGWKHGHRRERYRSLLARTG